MSKVDLPKTIIVKGYVYYLKHTDFPDENQYNTSYAGQSKWPKKKVLLQFSETSRQKCVNKTWRELLKLDYKVVEV